MYKVMALAAYEDRYVIPTAHREFEEDVYALRGSTGFGFREATTGNTKTNLFGGTKRAPAPAQHGRAHMRLTRQIPRGLARLPLGRA